jgi:dihydrofolate reductase
MQFSIIVAISENGIIGRGGKLPWRLSDDLRHFKKLTMGHTVIMGRRTWESIGRPLPGRQMIVVSRQLGYQATGCQVVTNLDDAFEIAQQIDDDEAFVIGGAEVYRLALPRVDRLYLTRVHAKVEGDTRFHEFDLSRWRLLESNRVDADERNEFAFSLEVYQRV